MPGKRFVRSFAEIGIDDVPLVGGKNASLGEMYQHLCAQGVKVPNGFAITAEAYRYVLDRARAWEPLHAALDGLKPDDMEELMRRGRRAREVVYGAELPDDLAAQILDGYRALREQYGENLSLAVRSSATAEDLPSASFAGQQDSYLNVHGEERLLDACKRCFASLFTDRSIHYRVDHGFDHFKVSLSIGVMKMVRADLAASGILFSLDTETGFRDVVLISAAYGLGENVVQGSVDPDEFLVFKPTLARGHRAVLRRSLGSKKLKMVYLEGGTRDATRNLPTPAAERERFCIDDEDVLTLADYAVKIERHYGRKAGRQEPMDIEWAKDGLDQQLYVVQARPETVASNKRGDYLDEYTLQGSGRILITGRSVGTRIGSGGVNCIPSADQIARFKPGEVLVTDSTTPDWEPIMKQAAAIVTNRGGRTCHAAIVAREFGIPAVIGCENATERLATGTAVTVSCAEGDVGRVYEGRIPFLTHRIELAGLARPATKIMLILGNPDIAFQTSFLPNDGVGLARMEFVITETIKAHPMALLHPEKVLDEGEREALLRLTRNSPTPADFFVQRLAEGIGTIAAAFYPKPVIVRMSDFKSNEYAGLLGGRWFEVAESNPMLGFRGASRYTHPAYAEGFALECAAMKRAREVMGLVNIKLMIPFCRRVDEGERVVRRMRELGLERGKDGLEIYAMCEIPNNVLLIDEFSRIFDGFSIGSNDLTQLTLGVDRDSALVAFDFDERDAGVKEIIRLAVEGCRRNHRHSGLCGQAPSDFPEFAEYLVRLGIDSISLNPDAIVKTTVQVLEIEKQLGASAAAAASAGAVRA
ncbi:MAG: phosphoenolpyruvate synthase [Gammaproteobacteria bacterium]|nr:phosphoenolpyruvate synthase [Gammaproteobacteria bacterium]MDE2347430.1 phosphoenolpyruvate synthase [Gammaproteobacteria bacterium]